MTEASVVTVGTPQSFRQQVARVLEVESDDVGWVQSPTAAEELLINAYSPIDVLVLSPEVKEPDALGLAEFVGRTSPGTAIVLVRDHTWNGLLPAAMRAGIRDVVDMTQGTDELREAVERAIVWASNLRNAGAVATAAGGSKGQRGHIVSVFSSKGGSGKTFLTTNLATAIADVTGQDTAVVDLDVDMGDVFTYFGREPSATIHDLMELGEGATSDQIRSVAVEVAPHTWAFGAPPDPAAEAPAGEAIGKFLRAIRNEFAYVVVDASVDYSDSALVCFDLSDMICLVTGLDVVGVKHLAKALDTLLTIGLPRERFRVVLNRADSKVGLDASDVERVMKISVDAMIPSSRLVPTSLNKGRPVVLDEPGSDVAQSISSLAQRFVGGAATASAGDDGLVTATAASIGGGKKRRGGLFAKKA
jgi:pilus assembly protein CpaE